MDVGGSIGIHATWLPREAGTYEKLTDVRTDENDRQTGGGLLSSLDYRWLRCAIALTAINLLPCVSRPVISPCSILFGLLVSSLVGCGVEFAAWLQTTQRNPDPKVDSLDSKKLRFP
jgi:hypothetical protein